MKIMTERLKFTDVYPDRAGELAQKLHIKKDEIPLLRKSYLAEKSEIKKGERAVISYISTATKDRDNEQLLPDGADLGNYSKNPIVLYGHDYKSLPIGKNMWIKADDKGLVAKTVFGKSEFADTIYKAYTEDIGGTGPLLKGWSVGFIPKKWKDRNEKDTEDAPERIYTEWEMLEYSAVPIPSCPEALTLAYQKGIIPERIQKDLQADIDELELEKIETTEEKADETKEVEVSLDGLEEEKEADVHLKPETTDNYHRIPVSEGHDDHEIKTITISAKEGIKALYCVTCKEIKTYLFDVEKWTMEEAKKWVEEHKEFNGELEIKEDNELKELIKDIRSELIELKEGRVLSTKNRTLIKSVIDSIEELKGKLVELHDATEPPAREEGESREVNLEAIKTDKTNKANKTDKADKQDELAGIDQKLKEAISKLLTSDALKDVVKESVQVTLAKAKGEVI
jgi:hypothetical protein